MTSVSTDRRFGVNSGMAVKVPVKVATTAAITLSGEQTVDGVSLVTGDRCLVKDQSSGIDNGVYTVDTGAWSRAADFDGSYDVVQGTLIVVAQGTVSAGQVYRITTANPITIGTTSLSFDFALSSATMTFTQSGTGAVARTVQAVLREKFFSVADFGAVGDGVTNDTTAIQNAINAAVAAGGGTIFFPNTSSNIYYLGTSSAGSVSLPVLTDTGTAYTAVSTSMPYHFYLLNKSGLRFLGNNVTIKSGVTSGGEMFIFNGCRDIVWDGIHLQSVMAFNTGTGAITTTGMGSLAFTATAQDSDRIRILNRTTTDCYEHLYIFGDGASAYRVRDVVVDNGLCVGGEYGIATHNNGNNVTINNLRVSGVNARVYFAYGVQRHQGQIEVMDPGYSNLFGKFLFKAYDYATSDIALKIINRQNNSGSIPTLSFQSQHYTATQPTPLSVKNVSIEINDAANTSGYAAEFRYIQSTATYPTTVSTQLWDSIDIAGQIYDLSALTTTVAQAPIGRVSIDRLSYATGTSSPLYQGKGFAWTRDVIASTTYTDAAAHTMANIANLSGILYVRESAGSSTIPFYGVGGSGVGYVWNVLDPDTGWLANQAGFSFSFSNVGTAGNTYTVAGVNGTGNFTIQRTAGAADYSVTVEAFRRGQQNA